MRKKIKLNFLSRKRSHDGFAAAEKLDVLYHDFLKKSSKDKEAARTCLLICLNKSCYLYREKLFTKESENYIWDIIQGFLRDVIGTKKVPIIYRDYYLHFSELVCRSIKALDHVSFNDWPGVEKSMKDELREEINLLQDRILSIGKIMKVRELAPHEQETLKETAKLIKDKLLELGHVNEPHIC